MSAFLKKYVIVSLLLALAASSVSLYKIASRITVIPVDIFKLPLKIGLWEGKDIPMDNEIYQALQTRSVILREYSNPGGDGIVLTIVYYSGNRVELHLPERCSVGQGSDIIERSKEDVIIDSNTGAITANKLMVKIPGGKQVILYYFQDGNFLTPSYFALRLHMISNKLHGKPNSGALIKFSAFIKNNADETTDILKQFIKEISNLLSKYLM